jgi:hypothetical protein
LELSKLGGNNNEKYGFNSNKELSLFGGQADNETGI